MIRDGTSRSVRRLGVALLAAWMAIFAVIAGVHNHGLLGPVSRTASLDQPSTGAGAVQVVTCFACLASHVPVPVPGGPVCFSAPHVAAEALQVTQCRALTPESSHARSSRAPPSPSTVAARSVL